MHNIKDIDKLLLDKTEIQREILYHHLKFRYKYCKITDGLICGRKYSGENHLIYRRSNTLRFRKIGPSMD